MMRTKLAIFEIYIGLNNIENIYIANNTRKYGNIIVRKKKIYKNTFRFLFFFYVLLYLISIHLNAN